jgi:hypothetical protein
VSNPRWKILCVAPILLLCFLVAPIQRSDAWLPHGFTQATLPGQSVINLNYANGDVFNNLTKSLTFGLNGNSPTLFQTNGFPNGTLTNSLLSNPNPSNNSGLVRSDYYGHLIHQWTGKSSVTFSFSSAIIYSGGGVVNGVSPASSGVVNGGNVLFSNYNSDSQTTDANVEFAFGTLITAVSSSGGLVEFSTQTNGIANNASTFTVQINNTTGLPTGPNSDGSWTATKIDAQTFTLANSGAYVGLVGITSSGGPGVQSEMIYSVPNGNVFINSGVSITFSNWILCEKANLSSIQAGQLITQRLITNIQTGIKAGYIRYMDFLGTQGTYSNFTDRIQPAFMSWQSLIYPANRWGGTSTGSSDEFDISNPSGSPSSGAYQDGEVVQFTANRSQVGWAPTAKLGSRSSAPIISASGGFGGLNIVPLVIGLTTTSSALANSSISGSGTTATVTTSVAHGLTNGAVYGIKIAGSTPSGFNATALCTVTGTTTFTCPNTTSGSASVVGTWQLITATGDNIALTFTGSQIAGGSYTFNYTVNTTATTVTSASVGAGTNVLAVTCPCTGTVTPGQTIKNSGINISNGGYVLPYGTQSTTGTGGAGTYALSMGQASTKTVTSLQGNFSVDGTLGQITANISAVIAYDQTLAAAGLEFGNDAGIFVVADYRPSQGQITGSTSTSGTVAETAFIGTLPPSQGIVSGTSYALQYSGILNAWILLNSSSLFEGSMPLEAVAEISTRAGVGAWMALPVTYTQSSWNSLGAWAAANMPGVSIIIEWGNEIWNGSALPFGQAGHLGYAVGLGGNGSSQAFRAAYSFYGLSVMQNFPAFSSGYTGAGGSSSNVHPTIQNWALDSLTNNPSNTSLQAFRWNGTLLTPTPATGTATFGTTFGFNTVTLSGISGHLYIGYTLSGSCVTGTPHVSMPILGPYGSENNGTYIIDSAQSGSCSVTLTNPVYATASGPGGTSNASSYNAFPNRPIDYVDNVGYAIYYSGALVGLTNSTFSGTQSFYNNIFQASDDFATGVGTSNPTLTAQGLNEWNTDIISGSRNSSFAQGTTINSFLGQGAFTAAGTAVSPSYETLISGYDGARPSGKPNLSVYLYEGGIQETMEGGDSGTTTNTATTLNTKFTNNGWTALDATFGYPGFGAGSSQTATNMVSTWLAYVNSPQFYHTHLCFWQQLKAIHSARPVFMPAQFGVDGAGTATVQGSALWGWLTGGTLASSTQQNFNAMHDYSSGVTATCP